MARFFPVEQGESFRRGGGLVGLGPNPVNIIKKETCVAVAVELAHGLFHRPQLLIAKVR